MLRINQAFLQDCNKLIENFLKYSNPDFDCFCQEWKKMHFANVYSPLYSAAEIAKLTNEMLLVAKKIVVSDRSHMERMGALYILYAIYFKQPAEEFIKIKVTLKEWKGFKSLWEWLLSRNGTMQGRLIFCKLYTAQAFRIVFTDRQYGFERFYSGNRNQEDKNEFLNASEQFGKDLKGIVKSDGLLPAFEVLQDGYNEMKEIMSANNKDQHLPPTDLFTSIKAGFDNIERILSSHNGADNEDKSEAGSSCGSIRARRVNIKRKAFAKDPQSHKLVERNEFQISVEGDFIQITKRENSRSMNYQRSDYILYKDLSQEGLHELEPQQSGVMKCEVESEGRLNSSDSLSED